MDFEDMTPEEIAEMIEEAKRELARRQSLAMYQDRQTQLQEEFRAADMIPKPPEGEWVKPDESLDAYGVGDVVTHKGTERRAKAGMVVCEPSCDVHWEDAGEEDSVD